MEYKISLKAARVNANLTQEEVAKALHKTKATICAWESGKINIRATDLMRLCELYSVPMSAIFLG